MSVELFERILYWHSTGGIFGYYSSSAEEPISQYGPDARALEVEHPELYLDTHYVLNGVLTAKTAMTPTVTGTTISNLPIPCHVESNGGAWDVDDGVAELSYAQNGTYAVTITSPKHLTFKTTVTQ